MGSHKAGDIYSRGLVNQVEESGLPPEGNRKPWMQRDDLASVCRRPGGRTRQMAGRTLKMLLQKHRQRNMAT